jgi:hypothetical protein
MRNLVKNRSIIFIAMFLLSGSFIWQYGCSSKDSPSEPTKKGPQVVLSPENNLYFGQIPQGHTATREFLIYNTGDEPLIISNMTIEGSDASLFSLINIGGEITVPINKIKNFEARFDPEVSGSFEAQVTITSNAKSNPDVQDLAGISTASAGNITFERIIGSFGNDGGGTIRVLADGGFIIAGSSYNQEEDETLATLFRLDPYGNLEWKQQYPVAGLSGFSGLVVTSSGNFVCTGSTRTNPSSNPDVFALSTTDNGDILWQEIYELGGIEQDDGNDIIKTTHGGYMICGSTKNTDDATGGVKDALLLKIDNSGSYQWHKVYGTREGEEAHSVKQTKNGGYIFGGSTTVPSEDPGGDFDFLMVKTDGDGNQLWSKTFGGSNNYDFASSIVVDELGGYVIAGYTASFGAGARDYWVIKTDTSGIEEWNKTYGGPENDSVAEIIQTSDNGFYIVGGSSSFTTGTNGQPRSQVWVIKTDNNGNIDWDELYGGNGGDGGASGRELEGGGYIISGNTSSYSDNSEVYVLKTNDDGSI